MGISFAFLSRRWKVEMTYVVFVGCGLMVFGPAAAMFWGISGTPENCVLVIASAFFWLLSTALAGLWWTMIPPLQSSFVWVVLSSVAIVEGGRVVFYKGYSFVMDQLAAQGMPPLTIKTRAMHAASAGLGYGLIHAAAAYGAILYEARGPGALFAPACPGTSLFFVNGPSALASLLMNVAYMLVAVYGYHRAEIKFPLVVAAAHLAAGLTTLFFEEGGSCGLGVSLLFTITTGVLVLAGHVTRRILQEHRMDVY